MKVGASILLASALVVWCAASVSAHRLDEYLQASRISLGQNAVEIEIDLTPGAAVASKVIALIDTDRDGQLSEAERKAYATLVVRSAVLELDRRRVALALTTNQFPEPEAMRAGTGTIRLTAHSRVRAGSTGRHTLRYFNIHEPEISVYLANAMVAPMPFMIAGQMRDFFQHELTVDYSVEGDATDAWVLMGVTFLAAVVGRTFQVRRRRRA